MAEQKNKVNREKHKITKYKYNEQGTSDKNDIYSLKQMLDFVDIKEGVRYNKIT